MRVQRARSTRTYPLRNNLAGTRNFAGLVGKISIDRYRNAGQACVHRRPRPHLAQARPCLAVDGCCCLYVVISF